MNSHLKIKTANIYDYINRDKLPLEIRDYYKGRAKDGFFFLKDLLFLKEKLLTYKFKNEEEELYVSIFLGLVGYFLGEYKLTLYFFRKIDTKVKDESLIRLMMDIKYSIRKLDKILILTDGDFSELHSLNELKKIYGLRDKVHDLNIEMITEFSITTLQEQLIAYEQVFILGHGDDEVIQLKDTDLKPERITEFLKTNLSRPNVLGIFSCGNAFNTREIYENVDYFITDDGLSAPFFVEMFLYGYVRKYYNNFNVLDAFDIGRMGPIIRAVEDPTIILYEKGRQIK